MTMRELRRGDWPLIEELFGPRGGCGGCWCMAWRSTYAGAAYRERQGEPNREDFERLVTSGKAHGVLAFDGKKPVGWCSIGPRADFPALARSRVLKTEWDDATWSVTCFLVRREHRGRGVATAMLQKAIEVARKHGARTLEGYPAKINPNAAALPAPFIWTGVPVLFERAGFERISAAGARPIYRRNV